MYQQVWQVDAEPTSQQMQALAAIERDSAGILKRWDEFKSADLLTLNRLLRESKIPEIVLESEPHPEEPQVEEE